MKVILTSDIESLGSRGEIKEVKNGYARNFLLPKKLAMEATRGNLKLWEQNFKVIQRQELKLKDAAEGVASSLDGLTLVITVKAGEEGKLFGSVTSQNISDALKEKNFDISRKDIELDAPIKALGTYEVKVRLFRDVSAAINVDVVSEDAPEETPEAETQQSEVSAEAVTEEEAPTQSPEESEGSREDKRDKADTQGVEAAESVESADGSEVFVSAVESNGDEAS